MTATLKLVTLVCLPVFATEKIEIQLPAELAFGGHHIQIQYPGHAGLFEIVNNNHVIVSQQSPGLLIQSESFYLPDSTSRYHLAITPDHPKSFEASSIHISRLDVAAKINTTSDCHKHLEQPIQEVIAGHYQSALELLNTLPQNHLIGCVQYHIVKGEARFKLMRFQPARIAYSRALQQLENGSHAHPGSRYTQMWQSYAWSYLLLQLGFSEILSGDETSDSQRILDGFNTLARAKNHIDRNGHTNLIPELHNARATFYRVSGDTVKASEELQTAIRIMQNRGQSRLAASYINNSATLYRAHGDYAAAQRMFSKSIQLAELSNERIAKATQHNNLATTYVEVGDQEAAKRYYIDAIELSKPNGSARNVATAKLGLAEIALANKAVSEAQRYLEEVESLAPDAFRITGPLYALLAEVHAILLNKERSNHYFNKAQDELLKKGRNTDKLRVLFTLIRSSIANNIPHQVDALFNQTKPLLVENHPHQIEYFRLRNKAIFRQSEATGTYPHQQIKDNFRNAFNIMKHTEQTLSFFRLGPRFKNNVRGLIDDYLQYLFINHDNRAISEAILVMELYQSSMMRKSRIFYRQFYQQGSEANSIKNQDYFEAQINLLNTQSDHSKHQALRELDRRQEALDAANPSSGPILTQLVSDGDFSSPNLSENLNHNEALIRYFDLDHKTVAAVVTRKEQFLYDIDQDVRRLMEGKNIAELFRLSSDKFFPTQYLKTSNISKLIIISDHLSHLVPFSALTMNQGQHYVNAHFTTIRAFSALEYLDQSQTSNLEQKKHIAVFADPAFNSQSGKLDNNNEASWRLKLPRLIYSADEAKAIADSFPNYPIIASFEHQATSDVLMSDDTRRARVSHIATHGFYDPDTPGIVGLLTSDSNSTMYPNGFVSLTQLLSQPFYSDLVVLSGCDTMRGEVWLSEGHNSLSRGILAQGAGSTLATLWKVSDRATAHFMEHFYQNLAQTGNSSIALQSAKQKMKRSGRFRSPRYWAGFVLTVANRNFETIRF